MGDSLGGRPRPPVTAVGGISLVERHHLDDGLDHHPRRIRERDAVCMPGRRGSPPSDESGDRRRRRTVAQIARVLGGDVEATAPLPREAAGGVPTPLRQTPMCR
jgi:hypothetical protein